MLYFDKQNFKAEKAGIHLSHTNKCLQNLEATSTGHILQTSKAANYLPVNFLKNHETELKNFTLALL